MLCPLLFCVLLFVLCLCCVLSGPPPGWLAVESHGYGNMLCTPCGGCRQRIREFSEPNIPVIIGNENGIQKVFTLNDLLPFSFGPENLNENN